MALVCHVCGGMDCAPNNHAWGERGGNFAVDYDSRLVVSWEVKEEEEEEEEEVKEEEEEEDHRR